MAEYAISTNMISWVPAQAGLFGWPKDAPEAETVDGMNPGDILIPKFAQSPDYRRTGSQKGYVQAICNVLDLDYDEQLKAYGDRIAWGEGAVPFLMRVT